MLKSIIMDFDGLIVDTEVVWYHVFAEWFRKNKNYEISMQEFLICVGSRADKLFRQLNEQGLHVDLDSFLRDTEASFVEESNRLPAKPGVEAFLKSARENGLSVSLATSSHREKPEAQLRRLGLIQYFDKLITADDVEHCKPYPDLFLKAAEALGSAPEECLVVEDSLNGLIAGRRANMRVMVVPNEVTRHSSFEGQYRTCASLEEVDVPALIAAF